MSPAEGSVAAKNADGTIRYAYIDGTTQWPMVGALNGASVPLPGKPAPASAIAIVPSGDNGLHIVWQAADKILFVSQRADRSFGTVYTFGVPPLEGTFPLTAINVHDPTIAIGPTGDVAIAFAYEVSENGVAYQPPRIAVAHGTAQAGNIVFGALEVASPGCCVSEWDEVAHTISGPSLAIGPDGATHVVYEWSSNFDTIVEYTHNRTGQFAAPIEVSRAAFVPCPSLAVDANGAYVTFLVEPNRRVFYVSIIDDVVSEHMVLYESSDYITMSMMARDATGNVHVAVQETTAAGGRLLYLKLPPFSDEPELVEPTEITLMESPGFVELTPRAGGFTVTDAGDLLFGYERVPTWNEMGQAEVAFRLAE